MLNQTIDKSSFPDIFDPVYREEMYQSSRNTKKSRRKQKNVKSIVQNNRNNRPDQNILTMRTINPITDNQRLVYESYYAGNFPVLHGTAGTGKTFIALYLALKDVLDPDTSYERVIIVRSCVPTRNTGFLPGSQEEKEAIYETPYMDICDELFKRKDAYERLKKAGKIEFTSTSYLRGTTFRNAIVIFDEFQSTTFHEFSSVITRFGDNCRGIVCGDIIQNDITTNEKKDAIISLTILQMMNSVDVIEFEEEDIVRSGMVKEFIIASNKYQEIRKGK